jgi:uncharacterized protein (TIGR00369 family)
MTVEHRYGVVSREALTAEDGLTFLRGVLEGRHPAPPISETLGFAAAEVEEGRVVFRGSPSPAVLNPLGTVHGGWAATLLDSAMACAVHATLKAGEAYTTLEMKLNYVRPILPDAGEVVCEGRVVHRGTTIATSEGRLLDGRGKLLAHGTETCQIFPATRGR